MIRHIFYRRLGVAAAASLLASTSACASSAQYMGIGFATGAASTELQALAMRAQAGDKQAQLDLGIAYEEGRGVAANLDKAKTLFRLAATDSGGPIWVYFLKLATRREGS